MGRVKPKRAARSVPYNAMLMPCDAPIRASELKRLSLFFDCLIMLDPSDDRLLHQGDIKENFSSGQVVWSDRAPFPRVEGFAEAAEQRINAATPLRGVGGLKLIDSRRSPVLDAGVNWSAYCTAISNPALVAAAVPDLVPEPGRANALLRDGVYSGGVLSLAGQRSRYAVDASPAAHPFGEVGREWSVLAHARIGRAIKALRVADATGAIPIATAEPEQSIVKSLIGASDASGKVGARVDRESAAGLAMWLVDHAELERALVDEPWSEVLKMRAELRPLLARVRSDLDQLARQLWDARRDDGSRTRIERLRSDYRDAVARAADESMKLRIAAVLKGAGAIAGAVGVDQTDLVALPSGRSIPEIVLWILTVGLSTGAMLSSELKTAIPARTRVRQHPLFAIDSVFRRLGVDSLVRS